MSIIVSTLRKSSSSSTTSMLSGIVVHLLLYQCDVLFIKLMFVVGLSGLWFLGSWRSLWVGLVPPE